MSTVVLDRASLAGWLPVRPSLDPVVGASRIGTVHFSPDSMARIGNAGKLHNDPNDAVPTFSLRPSSGGVNPRRCAARLLGPECVAADAFSFLEHIMRSSLTLLVAFMLSGAALADDPAKPRTPTVADVSYGPDERNVLDFWQAEGEGPRPLLVYIHGGGWVVGDKKQAPAKIHPYLEKGISYAAINYRLSGEHPLPAPVHDAARAIQFLRSKAEEWNLDPSRIALTGGSAGACTSMWILLHDDLADPQADDPVRRESTRVAAAAVSAGQTSIDPKVIEPWLGPNVLKHRMIWMAVGEPTMEAAMKNYEKHEPLYVEFSPYNHLDGDDPPLLMVYGNNMKLPSEDAGHGIHHPVYGVKMKEKADRVGQECHLLISGVSKSEKYATSEEFLIAKLLEP